MTQNDAFRMDPVDRVYNNRLTLIVSDMTTIHVVVIILIILHVLNDDAQYYRRMFVAFIWRHCGHQCIARPMTEKSRPVLNIKIQHGNIMKNNEL